MFRSHATADAKENPGGEGGEALLVGGARISLISAVASVVTLVAGLMLFSPRVPYYFVAQGPSWDGVCRGATSESFRGFRLWRDEVFRVTNRLQAAAERTQALACAAEESSQLAEEGAAQSQARVAELERVFGYADYAGFPLLVISCNVRYKQADCVHDKRRGQVQGASKVQPERANFMSRVMRELQKTAVPCQETLWQYGFPRVEMCDELQNQASLRDRRAYISQLICYHFEFLAIGGHVREIIHVGIGKLLLQKDGPRIFVVIKIVLKTIPRGLSRETGFKDGVEKVKRDRAINPLFDDSIKTIPLTIFLKHGIFRRCNMIENVEGTSGIEKELCP
ncbi:hypothetical protein KSS87_004089 [Heliosperma pusillum]|nr:hypothetical protein KSS87_004089 [Heliosperma pusillum]